MKIKPLLPVLALCLAFGALAGCGDDDGGDTGSATVTESAEATTEAGEDSASGEDSAGSGNAAAPSGDAVRSVKVEIEDFAYYPDPVKIEEGGKVTWQNEDSAPHTATADDSSFDTGTLGEGKRKSETFKQAGTYSYICSIHPDMTGTVEVVAG